MFCIPCLLFSDEVLHGENTRQYQGNAFVSAGFSNWKKQLDVKEHEASQSQVHTKVSEVLFLEEKTSNDIIQGFQGVRAFQGPEETLVADISPLGGANILKSMEKLVV